MKVCFIGACGHWRQAYLYLKTRQDVVFGGFAASSIHEKQTDSLDEIAPYYFSYEQMLDEVKPDLAIVSPIFGLTGKMIMACASRGIDVFSEKPIAASFEELDRVYQAIKDSGIRFCAMHYLRYAPEFFHAAEMVKDGKIGKIQMITAQKSYKYGPRPDWYGDPDLYCGTIPWVGIHAIDWIYHFSGKRFVSVTAQSVGNNPEMAALCQFTLEDNRIASANIDYYRPDAAPTHGDDRIRCVGTDGVLEVGSGKILLINQEGLFEYCPDTAPELLAEFIDGGTPIPLEEIYHITKVAIAAKVSAETKEPVMIGA